MKREVNMPSPITGGRLEKHTEHATVEFRGETIGYEKTFYRCVDTGYEFVDEELEKANLKKVYDTYRRNHSIPLAEELKEMRERYGIPASAMSLILGLGENQFGLYEDGVVPSPSVGKLLALAMVPENMKEMLLSARPVLSDKQYGNYFSAIDSIPRAEIYEVEAKSIEEYEIMAASLPSGIFINNGSRKFNRKFPYSEYIYVTAC